ncbi:MAG: flavin reductase [Thaumarchaeota archaeon]|nr:flavin reductase [Nitrososphaerota archaeon]
MKVNPSLIHRLFYPQVAAVLCAKAGGRVSAMPVVSYASVSSSPPMVAVACAPGSYTCRLATRARAFSLCILGKKELGSVERLAATSGSTHRDKLTYAGLAHERGRCLDVPVISSAAAVLECALSARKKLGDHLLLVGEVRASFASRAFSDFWDFRKYKPILYAGWKDRMTNYPEGMH